MDEDTNKKEGGVEAAINAVTGLAKAVPVYQDAIQPAAKELGKSLDVLAKTVNIALAPLSIMVWGYDQIRDFVSTKVTEKLSNTPEGEIVTPPSHIAGPALESLRYIGSIEELRNLYANLLASAMDSKTAELAHPSFVEIIRQLNPNEAKILASLTHRATEPMIKIKNNRSDGKGGRDQVRHFTLIGSIDRAAQGFDVAPNIDNLIRLGLISVPESYKLIEEGLYNELETHPFVQSVLEKINSEEGRTGEIVHTAIMVTDFGRQFISTCVLDHRISREI